MCILRASLHWWRHRYRSVHGYGIGICMCTCIDIVMVCAIVLLYVVYCFGMVSGSGSCSGMCIVTGSLFDISICIDMCMSALVHLHA